MPTPEDYQRQIDALDLEGVELSASTVEEAKSRISQIRSWQRELRQIKKSINADIKAIRSEYRERIANAGTVTGGVFSLFGKRGAAGSIRASAKRGMTSERDSIITPFEDLKFVIDNSVHALDNAKCQFEEYVSDNKVNSKKSNDGTFCPSCGDKVGKTHKFCVHCGASLE